jgi:sulfite reductase beta subunit-like hemoprotein
VQIGDIDLFFFTFFFFDWTGCPYTCDQVQIGDIGLLFFFWAGCPNTCAQVQIGDIGLLGTTAKDSNGQVVEAVDIFTGGGIGQNGAIGTIYKKGVPIDEQLEHELSKLLVCLNAKP